MNQPDVFSDKRDMAGATPLHLCFLYNSATHQNMAKAILARFPLLITSEYTGAEYLGENCLHIATINKEVQLVEHLLDLASPPQLTTLLNAQARGRFFHRQSACYYGEYPLFFAACTQQKVLVDLLLEKGDSLNKVDSNGNTILHLLVIHSLQDMYMYILKKWQMKKKLSLVREDLWKVRNNDGLTPFTLAADLNNAEMFEFLMEHKMKLQWSYGPVTCFVFVLNELDTPFVDKRDRSHESAIEIILRKAHFGLLASDRVREVVEKKWTCFAEKQFAKQFLMTATYIVILCSTVVLQSYSTEDWWLTNLGQATVLAGAIAKSLTEMQEVTERGFKAYWAVPGSGFLDNSLGSCHCITIMAATLLRALGCELARPLCALSLVFGTQTAGTHVRHTLHTHKHTCTLRLHIHYVTHCVDWTP